MATTTVNPDDALTALIAATGARVCILAADAKRQGYRSVKEFAASIGASRDFAQRRLSAGVSAGTVEKARINTGVGGGAWWYRPKR